MTPQPVVKIIDDVNTPIITIEIYCSLCKSRVSQSTYDTTNGIEQATIAAKEGFKDGRLWLEHTSWHGKAANA